jgi:NTP pyrophosphatase (non-canonical NTP hydrolase)
MTLEELQREQKKLVEEKGFSLDLDDMYKFLTLLHSEVSELADVWKKEKDLEVVREKGGLELADIIIRTMHIANILGVSAQHYCELKMAQNFDRPFRYNEVR